MKAQFIHFVLSAALILMGLPLSGFGQSNKPDATVNITKVTVRTQGTTRILEISWQVAAQGGATPQKFDVRADAKIVGGGKVIKTISLGGDARFTKLAISAAEAKPQTTALTKSQPNNSATAELKTNKTSSVTPGIQIDKGAGNSTGGSKGTDNRGTIQPQPPPAGAGFFVIDSAFVTVTGTFRGDNEAVNLTREFVPPANQQGELKPRSGSGNADIVLNKLIELKKSPRAAQCAAGRDCFEVVTGANDFLGNGGKGFTVNLEVIYADGSRKTAAAVLPTPGRATILDVDNPKNLAFNSARISVRGQGDGLFTRKATRDELLSF